MEFVRKYPVAAAMADTDSYVSTSPRTADEDPLRIACSRAVATFLSPNATKELPVDAIVRDTVIRSLAYDCHPDVVSRINVHFPDIHVVTLVFACL